MAQLPHLQTNLPSPATAHDVDLDSPSPLQPDGASSPRARAGSFGFLRRTKSTEQSTRNDSRLFRKKSTIKEEAARRQEREATTNHVPPFQMPNLPPMNEFFFGFEPTPRNRVNGTVSSGQVGYNSTTLYNSQQPEMDTAVKAVHANAASSFPQNLGHEREDTLDHPAMTGSITNRGRIRRKKDPTAFNILVIGTKNSGKTSLINFICSSLSRPLKIKGHNSSPPSNPPLIAQHGAFIPHYLETEIDGERVGVTIYDSKGLEKHIVDLQLREMTSFLESKFEDTFTEEQKVLRTPGVKDTHIHCVLLMLDPSRLDSNVAASGPRSQILRNGIASGKSRVVGCLEEDLDVDVLRMLHGKTTVIPIISKADTITNAHMAYLKRTVSDAIKKLEFDPFEALHFDDEGQSDDDSVDQSTVRDDSDEKLVETGDTEAGNFIHDTLAPSKVNGINGEAHNGSMESSAVPQHDEIRMSELSLNLELPYLPMSVISPDLFDPGTVGRRFPWGFADPYNPEHCDLVRLKESVFNDWRDVLRQASRERWYEVWRTSRLKKRTTGPPIRLRVSTGGETRTVSGSAIYASNGAKQLASTADAHQRAVSSGEIGLAIGTEPNTPLVTVAP